MTDKSKSTCAESVPVVTRVHVPVMVAIMVPIEIDAEGLDVDSDATFGGMAVVDAAGQPDLVKRALEAASHEHIDDALADLMAGAMLYQRTHPTHKIVYSPAWGLIPEREM